ncbi:LytR C-terminal domain-containing protein [Candidatus Palauibacter sp.]|uniref:LytR C-terminal domain-containing protein n=1 Tax=Candidatus Palauibacter sp. TaxID=3101350 RepID=UPI003CC65EBF
MVSAIRGLITTATLIGAGALIGLFWEEWQVVRLAEPAAAGPAPSASSLQSEAPESPSPQLNVANRIKVEVLNGVGEAGLARRFADQLRERGFDVVATDNADHFEHQVTHVLDRSGRLGAAWEVANGVHSDSVVVVLDPDLFLDATVVVGHDWQEVLRRN